MLSQRSEDAPSPAAKAAGPQSMPWGNVYPELLVNLTRHLLIDLTSLYSFATPQPEAVEDTHSRLCSPSVQCPGHSCMQVQPSPGGNACVHTMQVLCQLWRHAQVHHVHNAPRQAPNIIVGSTGCLPTAQHVLLAVHTKFGSPKALSRPGYRPHQAAQSMHAHLDGGHHSNHAQADSKLSESTHILI